jgi:hypothetical protein
VSGDALIHARALMLSDLEATGAADAAAVSALEEAVATRRWWVDQWAEGRVYAAGLVAQDLQDALLDGRGRWPVCPRCPDATHALYVHPELGGPDPRWVCEDSGREIAPLGGLSSLGPRGLSGGGAPAT